MPGEVKVETDFSTGSRMEFSKSINITVNTNSPLGYKLLFSSDSEDSSLVSSDPKNDYSIPSVYGSDYVPSKDMHNQYGYNIKDTDDQFYQQIPSLSSPLKIKQAKIHLLLLILSNSTSASNSNPLHSLANITAI